MSYTLNAATPELDIAVSNNFSLVATGDFRGGQLLVLFSTNGVFQEYPDTGNQIITEPTTRTFETNGEPVKLKWSGDLGTVEVSTSNLGQMTGSEIADALNEVYGTSWNAQTIEGGEIAGRLDAGIGTVWRIGKQFVSDPNNPDPNNHNTYNVESQLAFTFVQSGAFTGASPLYLDFAGYDSNGFPTYTEGGQPIDEFEWSQAMSGIGMYNALRYVPEDQRWVLAHYLFSMSTQLSHYYSDVYGDVVAASINLSLWTYTYGSTSYMASIQFADVATGVLPSDHNGQIYQSTPTSLTYLSSVSDVDPVAWLPLVVDASKVTGGAVGYANGGTAATTQRKAVGNLSAFVSLEGAGRTLTTSDIGVTIVATSAGAITFTIPSGMPEHATIKITRRGTGDITIAAAGGVTIANTNRRINAQYDTVTIIRIGVNSFVLTGPLKA